MGVNYYKEYSYKCKENPTNKGPHYNPTAIEIPHTRGYELALTSIILIKEQI